MAAGIYWFGAIGVGAFRRMRRAVRVHFCLGGAEEVEMPADLSWHFALASTEKFDEKLDPAVVESDSFV